MPLALVRPKSSRLLCRSGAVLHGPKLNPRVSPVNFSERWSVLTSVLGRIRGRLPHHRPKRHPPVTESFVLPPDVRGLHHEQEKNY
jgi:hypothetical protein